MDLYANQPYWLIKDGLVASYNSLDKSITIDVVILGAGISGALAAYYLRNSGLNIAVLDRRHVGMGSTAASTAFLQYEIDTPLVELCGYVGKKNAVQAYRLCRKAIYDIQDICKKLKPAFGFHIRPSMQYASTKKDKEKLAEEYKLRTRNGFKIDWLEPSDIKAKYGFEAPAAIFSADGGEVDAYLLTHALLRAFLQKGHNVYNNTYVNKIEHEKQRVILHTDTGLVVKAKKLIIAAGYESLKYVPKKIANIHTTYALVSEPLQEEHKWYKNSLVWETANPYLYFRGVDDNRIMIGGKDDKFHNPEMQHKRVKRKTEQLLHAFSQKLKDIPVKADFSWAGAFAVTKDGLPYIGTIPGIPHTYFALGYGGNGITFSLIAAQIIKDALQGKKNGDAEIFSFNR